ncbi:MAG: TetR/AcrR family transcriptional regulator [Vicinamibacteria bacterium]
MGRAAGGGRRQEIAEAILRIAGREGVSALTMERLGRELGITSGALFRHFPSRTAMLNEAARHAVALVETTFPQPGLPPLARLRGLVLARTTLAAEHGSLPQIVFSEQFGKALPPSGARAVRGILLRTRAFLVEALREAAARGEVRRDVSAEDLALTLIGAMLARPLLTAILDDRAGRPSLDAEAAWATIEKLLGPCAAASAAKRRAGKRARAERGR